MPDALRLALGTLTRLPVPTPRTVDRQTAGAAMVLAPLVGGLLALVVGVVVQVLAAHAPATASTALFAALAIAVLAYTTRGLHLDGLADTADALGSGRPPEQALQIARRSDIGPFGVVTVVLVLLVQVTAYAGLVGTGRAALGLVIAAGTARLSLALSCARGVPAARSDGLGATVAGSVPILAAAAAAIGWLAFCCGLTAVLIPSAVPASALAVLGALLVTGIGLRVCVRRLGGITGDVLGALIELSFAAALVILVAVPS